MTDAYAPLMPKLLSIVREAGDTMRAFHAPRAQAKGGHYNFVTEADVAVQSLLEKRLTALLPTSRFYAEEQENSPLTGEPTWVVDPIDGTVNFMRRRALSAVSVALLADGEPVLGVVHNPYADEMFTAVRGQGAFLNGQSIRASDVPFERALVGFGTSPYNSGLAERSLRAACEFLLEAGDLRRSGSAAIDLADVACGRLDIMFELELSPWDVAAGALLVTEAGGVFGMPWQDAVRFGAPACVLAANPLCYERAAEIIKFVKN